MFLLRPAGLGAAFFSGLAGARAVACEPMLAGVNLLYGYGRTTVNDGPSCLAQQS
jgi:hypothetical protein